MFAMTQADLFVDIAPVMQTASSAKVLDMPGLLDRLTACCERPRYNFMLLTLIAEASLQTGSAGPFVLKDGGRLTIRDWLCDAMSPVGRREPRRASMRANIRVDLEAAGLLPEDSGAAAMAVDAELRSRLRKSGRTNVSRGVSELVRAGLLERYYQGDYVDHRNRGGQRHAVYTITDATRRALAQRG